MNNRASMHIYAKFMIDNLNIFSGGPEEKRRIFRKKIRYGGAQPEGQAKKPPFFTLPARPLYEATRL
ncbi:hypothetical protein MRO89_02480 [Dickeya dianthicola]|uniref:hypothetical protein n=1 Tax=Dickeya dianthicola TaxID=204039 RepID=UPI001867942A|nr:hypothetical protein [Dickeya dianthicola]MCI4184837.1 hypothetical protein [Dickeya dianthicola]QOL12817.1 hypothetical protein HGI48_00350 [Dickeya dianthicola]